MLALSVAIQSKEIAEGARRDSSALKSLNILAFLFFPPNVHCGKLPPVDILQFNNRYQLLGS
jgi:hypothetical protein